MLAGNIHPNPTHPHHCQRPPNGCIHPCTIQLTFGEHDRHPPHLPVAGTLKNISNRGVSAHISDPNRSTDCNNSPLLYYMLLPFPKYSPVVPSFPTPSVGSFPPPDNRRWRMATFSPSNLMKELSSEVSHTPRIPSPSVPTCPQQPSSVASSPSCSGTSLKSGAPN